MRRGFTLVELMIVLAIGATLFMAVFGTKAKVDGELACRKQLSAQGFNVKDIEVILKGTTYGMCDFLNSPTLQEKYGSKDLPFFVESQNQKIARDTRSAAQGAMIMSTMAAVSAASRPVSVYHR